MYTVIQEFRQRWAYAVCWNNVKPICRADSQEDAMRIARALNAQRDWDAPLTDCRERVAK